MSTPQDPDYVTPRDTDPLDVVLRQHTAKCPQCQEAIKESGPTGFGQRSKMCPEYFEIVQMFADGVNLR